MPVDAADNLSRQIHQACLLEATARKAGNVHPQASFTDLTYEDFVHSAEIATPWLSRARELGVGRSVRLAVEATQARVGRNSNLGIAMLLAPLAAVPMDVALIEGIQGVLAALTVEDAEDVYAAIRRAAPGGLGRVPQQDVAERPTETLLEVMRRAAAYDRIARQYATSFEDVLGFGVTTFMDWWDSASEQHRTDSGMPVWEEAVIGLQLSLLARWGDSLIERKCGSAVAAESAARADAVLSAGWPHTNRGEAALRAFDGWLRADGHRRNPGTTADLIAAILFAAAREQRAEFVEVVPPPARDL